MDLSGVAGVTPASRAALDAAGVRSPADLARVSDVGGLATRASLPPELIEGLREAARVHVIALLREAGVGDEAALARADADELASRTGMAREDVEWFQAAARETLAGLPPTRVTLRPGAALARVRVEGDGFEGVPVRTVKPDEAPAAILSTLAGDLVLVRPGHATATMRVAGATHEAVPVFAERDGGEVAVRVRDVRVKDARADASGAPGGPGLLSRFRRSRSS